jgi:hypothetical protein
VVDNLPPVSGHTDGNRPILAVDVDGVISLFGFDEPPEDAPCKFQLIDGMAHCISLEAGERLRRLVPRYELIWATGWEDRANEYLLHLLGLDELPVLRFGGDASFGSAHWKLGPISEYAAGRRLAWIDDSLDESCHQWARERPEPTLLVQTDPQRGLQDGEVDLLLAWAEDPDSVELPEPVPIQPVDPSAGRVPSRAVEAGSGEGEGVASRLSRWLRR